MVKAFFRFTSKRHKSTSSYICETILLKLGALSFFKRERKQLKMVHNSENSNFILKHHSPRSQDIALLNFVLFRTLKEMLITYEFDDEIDLQNINNPNF